MLIAFILFIFLVVSVVLYYNTQNKQTNICSNEGSVNQSEEFCSQEDLVSRPIIKLEFFKKYFGI